MFQSNVSYVHLEKSNFFSEHDLNILSEQILTSAVYVDPVGVKISNSEGWQSNWKNSDDFMSFHKMTEYKQYILKFCDDWLQEHGFYLKNPNLLMKGWFNINFPDSSNELHEHVYSWFRLNHNVIPRASSDLSAKNEQPIIAGTFYIKLPTKIDDSFYFSKNSAFLHFFSYDFTQKINVKRGDTILFPSDASHGVKPHGHSDLRISFSFNIHVERPDS